MHDYDDIDAETNKPQIILDYNRTKGGVDTVDQKCSTYTTKRKTSRWPLSLFFRMLDIAGINSEIIFNFNNPGDVCRRRKYLTKLAFQLIESQLKERVQLKNLPKDISLFLTNYASKPVTSKESSADARTGGCHICGKRKNNRTTVRCVLCQNFVCKNHSKCQITCNECNG